MNIEAVRGLARRWFGVGFVLALGLLVGVVVMWIAKRTQQAADRAAAEVRLRGYIRDYREAEKSLTDEFAEAQRATKRKREEAEMELEDERARLRREAKKSRQALASLVNATFWPKP